MNDQEKAILKAFNEVVVFICKGAKNVPEKETIQNAVDVITNQLVVTIGRRIIKESK